ncbi:hypothetical protein [Streptomyces rochei]|uniref:hypothetical protein n=1 Tax=Streptomyces rochei TaxID=1928 RepID=UPI0033A0285E
MTDHARTHIKALLETLKKQPPEQLAQPAGLFISGMLSGLAAGVQVLDGGTAEQVLQDLDERLSAAIGRAYLNGTLPVSGPAVETDPPLSHDEEIRGVQGWMALDVHRALGLPVDDETTHQGFPSWADWWADLCNHIAQRTRAAYQRAQELAVPDSLTFHNARQWHVHPEAAQPERLFFPIRYGAALTEAHPITPNDPPYMIDLVGYEDGDPLQERVLRLIVHRSLTTRLLRDLAAADAPSAAEATDHRTQRAEQERDVAYRERAYLVALLAAMTDGAVIAPAPDVDEPGWQIAYLTIGGHQATWHISPRDADLVAHIEPVEPDDPRAQWDGHSTELKYARIAAWTAELAARCGPACAEGHTYTGRCEGAHPRGADDSEATAPDVVHPVTEPQASSSQQVDEPCVQHPNAPVIGGMCGGCTQYPADMVPVSIQEPRDVQQ